MLERVELIDGKTSPGTVPVSCLKKSTSNLASDVFLYSYMCNYNRYSYSYMSESRYMVYIVLILSLTEFNGIQLFEFQECSLGYARNSRLESWPVDIFSLLRKHDF